MMGWMLVLALVMESGDVKQENMGVIYSEQNCRALASLMGRPVEGGMFVGYCVPVTEL